MASTVIRGAQIKDSTVQRHDLDTSTVGQAVVTKLVQGSGVTLSSTGADSGTGDVTVSTSAIPLAGSSTSGLMNQTSGNTTDFIDGTNNSQALQPVIWSVRLRTFQALSNNAFEVDQRNVGTALTNPANGTFIQDRWLVSKSAGLTGTVNTALQSVPTAPIVIPGTNFGITQNYQRFTVGTAQASLAAGDYWFLQQSIEGPRWRELASDVHSLSLLVRSSLASLAFSVSLRDATSAHSLVKQCTLGAANTWTVIPLPNLPVWSGVFSAAPGQIAYTSSVVLAAGTTYSAAASSAWQTANIIGVTGMSNFLATAGATFDIAYIGHEPGALCTTPQDCPFQQAYDDALRYFCKTYRYAIKPGNASDQNGAPMLRNTRSADSLVLGWLPFAKIMAKTPTIIGYSTIGTANAIRDITNGVDRGITTSGWGAGETGFEGFQITGAASALVDYAFHYTADTGW